VHVFFAEGGRFQTFDLLTLKMKNNISCTFAAMFKQMKYLLVLFLSGANLLAFSQSEVRVMHYNLLNFGAFTDYCTINNNDPAEKIVSLKTIVDHYVPDILVVNEIAPGDYYSDLVLDEALNSSGRDYFERAQASNLAGSNICNMLFYNDEIFGLAGQDVIAHYLRDINVYELYTKSPALQQGADTTFLYLISVHFKAGSSGSDKDTRAQMAGLIADYIETHQIADACLMTGDLNLQNSFEEAWQILSSDLPENLRFSDPANSEGVWHNNPDFAAYHTQSTHLSSNGCASSGGMDDRFDFILANPALFDTSQNIHYIDGSYITPGQDGERWNGSLLDPPNFSAPAPVLEAMYQLSDHLPLLVSLQISAPETLLPESWTFMPTAASQVLTISVAAAPRLNGSNLQAGSSIGVFFMDGDEEKCAGNGLWSGNENLALLAYGDDLLSPEKDGFAQGEPLILKVFSPELNADFYADASFLIDGQEASGIFMMGGIIQITRLDASYLQFHSIYLDEGWTSLSSFLNPRWKNLENIFGDNLEQVLYMSSGSQIFYPSGDILALNYWNPKSSFFIKIDQAFFLEVQGIPLGDLQYSLSAGWNLISVPVPCYLAPADLQMLLGENLQAIKTIADTRIFWPEKSIFTLEQLSPGEAYFIKVFQDCTLTFVPCEK